MYKYKYKNKNSQKKPSQFSKYKAKAKRFMAKSYKQETPYISFEKRVQKVIRANVEDKISTTYTERLPVATWNAITGNATPVWWNFRDLGNNVLTLSQNAEQNGRIGNKVMLKHLYLNMLITPHQGGDTKMDLYLTNTQMGYCTVYIGRQRDYQLVPTQLDNFFQLGASATTPNGAYTQLMFGENRDRYQILFKRTFKCGPAQGKGVAGIESNFVTSNNDFKVNHILKLDLAKYIKNKNIKYNDGDNRPTNAEANSLCVWAIWTPYQGSMLAGAAYTTSYFDINSSAWMVYEDA